MAQIAAQEKFLEAIKVTMATVLRAWVSPWVEALRLKGVQRMQVLDLIWWTWSGSNRRPLPCHGSALPAAPQAHFQGHYSLLELTSIIFADIRKIVNAKDCSVRSRFISSPPSKEVPLACKPAYNGTAHALRPHPARIRTQSRAE